jgi:hydroxyacylglutathione hydrolase
MPRFLFCLLALLLPLSAPVHGGQPVQVVRVDLVYAQAYLLRGSGGAVLVDTGLPGASARILGVARRAGIQPDDIDLIVLTHTHVDHAGAAAELARRTGAPVAVAAPGHGLLARGRGAPVVPHTSLGRVIAWVGKDHRVPAHDAEIVVRERLDLAPWGIDGFVMATPGHTACSQAVIVPGQVAVVGDLLVGPSSGPQIPNLRELPERVQPSIEAVLAYEPAQLMLGHVRPVELAQAQGVRAR